MSLSLAAPTASWIGVLARANMADPDRSHYAAFVSSGGIITLARREEWSYTFLAEKTGSFPSGTHRLTLTASGSSPVQLAVAVDGSEVLRFDDSSASALNGAGRAGFFDYRGSSQELDKFEVSFGTHFTDYFDRSGPIGSDWVNFDGSFTCNGSEAFSAAERSYAAWVGSASNPVVKFALSTPIAETYVGVFTRGDAEEPDRHHYAAFVDPNGIIKLRRRNDFTYSSLATGPAFPSGTHVIGVRTAGTDPVQITVTLDGETIIEYSDSSSSRLQGTKVGIFDYNGEGQPIKDFVVAEGPDAGDNFDGTTLGPEWTVSDGSFSVASSRAHSTAAESYAFLGPDVLNATASVEFDSAVLMQIPFSGVTLRDANGGESHYAGGVDANGSVRISRRDAGTYTHLATGATFPSGVHVLSLTATGTDPVQLSLRIDGEEWLHYTDSSASRIPWSGRAGIFSNETVYSSGQYFGEFHVFTDLVSAIPWDPVLGEIPPQTVPAGGRLQVFLRASDLNGGTLDFDSPNLPSGADITPYSRGLPTGPHLHRRDGAVLEWTPDVAQVGVYTPTITVTDDTGREDSQVVPITVTGPDCDPIATFESGSPDLTYYVDGVNGDDNANNGLSETSAFRTIQKGLNMAKARGGGTAVLILRKSDGTAYEESPTIHDLVGTASEPIWVGGKLGSEPILSDDKSVPGSAHEVLQLVRPQYVILHNMIIGKDGETTWSHGINIEDGGQHDANVAHHVVLRNLTFRRIGDGITDIQNCLKISGLNDFFVLDSTFNECGRLPEGGTGIDAVGCHDGFIARNRHIGRKFVQAKGGSRNVEIRRNRTTYSPSVGETKAERDRSYNLGGKTGGAHFRPSLTCDAGEFGCEVSDGSLHYEARHIRLIGNLIQAAPERAVGSGWGIAFNGCYECLVANNTILDPVDRFIYVHQDDETDTDTIPGQLNTFVSDGRVYNNIFYFRDDSPKKAQVNSSVSQAQWASFLWQSNLYCNRENPSTCQPQAQALPTGVADSGAVTSDPLFASGLDYPLSSSSPAKWTGGSLTSGSPSVLSFTGDTSATVASDLVGACYTSTPSIGAREVVQ